MQDLPFMKQRENNQGRSHNSKQRQKRPRAYVRNLWRRAKQKQHKKCSEPHSKQHLTDYTCHDWAETNSLWELKYHLKSSQVCACLRDRRTKRCRKQVVGSEYWLFVGITSVMKAEHETECLFFACAAQRKCNWCQRSGRAALCQPGQAEILWHALFTCSAAHAGCYKSLLHSVQDFNA